MTIQNHFSINNDYLTYQNFLFLLFVAHIASYITHSPKNIHVYRHIIVH